MSKDEKGIIMTLLKSKLKLRSWNKESGVKRWRRKSRIKEKSRSFSKSNQDEYLSCGISKKSSQLEKDCWPQCQY